MAGMQRAQPIVGHKRESAMMNRRKFMLAIPAVGLMKLQMGEATAQSGIPGSTAPAGEKGVMLMNRIGPSVSDSTPPTPMDPTSEGSWPLQHSTTMHLIPPTGTG